jgi:hypothetical protein
MAIKKSIREDAPYSIRERMKSLVVNLSGSSSKPKPWVVNASIVVLAAFKKTRKDTPITC